MEIAESVYWSVGLLTGEAEYKSRMWLVGEAEGIKGYGEEVTGRHEQAFVWVWTLRTKVAHWLNEDLLDSAVVSVRNPCPTHPEFRRAENDILRNTAEGDELQGLPSRLSRRTSESCSTSPPGSKRFPQFKHFRHSL